MQRIERKIGIVSSPEKIYKIVTDGVNTPKWNPVVNSVIEIEDAKIKLDTDLGGFTITDIETEENKIATWHMQKSDVHSIGYILDPKTNGTDVKIWAEFEDKKQTKSYKKTADLMLEGLKNFVSFIEKGGDPAHFNKWDLITP
ncbi:MAG: hypothetical protein ACFFB0_10685 [Promethearchaeota archaeon]